MEEQATPQPIEQAEKSKIILPIGISVIVTALIIGGSIYLWQNNKLKTLEQSISQQISLLHDQNEKLQKENIDLKATGETTPTTTFDSTDNIELPIVVYARPGLLNNTDEGIAEKKNLEEKLINPYIDYHNEKGINLVTLQVTVPTNVGDAYEVVGIFKNEKREDFLFGVREGDYDYWSPTCMDPCEYSDAFKAKYPQIVE